MKFGHFPLSQVLGSILAHSLKLPTKMLKKGHVVTKSDIDLLAENNISHVMAAILDEDDITEDKAAFMIAHHICGDHITCAEAFTGRVNLYAVHDGLIVINEDAVNALNHLDESATLATVPQKAIVQKGQMIATIKIIPLAVRHEVIVRIISDIEKKVITLHPFQSQTALLIHTELSSTTEKIFEKAKRVMSHRLDMFGAKIGLELRCKHEENSLSEILKNKACSDHDLILIMGASAITDRKDVIPAAIIQAGGEIIHYGMPVDPGNLMLVAKLEGKWVLGLPGCSRSPKLNGIDLILSQIAAGQNVTSDDIMTMGVGGLLSEYPGRPQPREPKVDVLHHKAQSPKIAALILAAGQSKRMGQDNKLLLPYRGKSVLSHVIEQIKGAGIDSVFIVTGHQKETIEKEIIGQNITLIHNDLYAEGMSGSVKIGMASLPKDVDAALIILGDMPNISSEILRQIMAAYNPNEKRLIVIPKHQGKRGNPILWDRAFFGDFERLEGDMGAKILLGEYPEYIKEVDIGSEAIFFDIDTIEAYERLKEK